MALISFNQSVAHAVECCKNAPEEGYALFSYELIGKSHFDRQLEELTVKSLFMALGKSFKLKPAQLRLETICELSDKGERGFLRAKSVFIPYEFNFAASLPTDLLKNGKTRAANTCVELSKSVPVRSVLDGQASLVFLRLGGFDILNKPIDRKSFAEALLDFCKSSAGAGRALCVCLVGPNTEGLVPHCIQTELNLQDALKACQNLGNWGKAVSFSSTGSALPPAALVLAARAAHSAFGTQAPSTMTPAESEESHQLLASYLGPILATRCQRIAQQHFDSTHSASTPKSVATTSV